MGINDPVMSFPSDIDREYFSAWLSGFSDGESCFFLSSHKSERPFHALVSYSISLRSDDANVLNLIRSFFGCGYLNCIVNTGNSQNNKNTRPCAIFKIGNPHDLVSKVIPHFDRYPLLAKKKRDFSIWREGVLLVYEVVNRDVPYKRGRIGKMSKWNNQDRERFRQLVTLLKKQREYKSPAIDIPDINDTSYFFGL